MRMIVQDVRLGFRVHARSLQSTIIVVLALALGIGQLHSLRVTVKHPWYHVDHRQAYLAPSSSQNTGGGYTPRNSPHVFNVLRTLQDSARSGLGSS